MSEMPVQRDLLNICFGCLRYSRTVQSGLPMVRPANYANVFLKGGTHCNHCRFASATQGSTGTQQTQSRDTGSIESNPFYEKYKDKLKYFAASDPDKFKTRVQQLEDEKKPKRRSSSGSPSSIKSAGVSTSSPAADPLPVSQTAVYSSAKGLDSIMKLELLQDKSPADIEQIWKEYHKVKDCVFSVLPRDAYEDLLIKGQSCPTFVCPLPRNDGYEFILMQFDGKDIQFTPLAMYQMLKENAPACLTLVHYTELMESKGIVLMSGRYDDKVLKLEDALMVVQMMAIYYGKNSPRFDVVQTFNHQPDKFDFNQLIAEHKALYLDKPAVNAGGLSALDVKQ